MSSSRKILKNIFSLSVAEAANKGIVFITTAYLARVILPEGFGVLNFANSILLYFLLVVNLGFNIVGIRETAKNPDKVKKYADQITTYRLILAIFSCVAMVIFAVLIDKPFEVKLVIIISGVNLFSQAIMMDWVYQGTEKMGILAIRQVLTSSLNLIGVLFLVKTASDVVTAMIITVISTLLNAIWMLALYNKIYGKLRLYIDKSMMKELLTSSIPIMFSSFFITIYNSLNIIMLGFMKSDAETGIYAAAFRFVGLVIAPSYILNLAFFPHVSRAQSIDEKRNALRNYSKAIFYVGTFLSFLFFTFSSFFITFAFGSNYTDSIIVLQVLMLTVLIMYMNTAYYPPLVAWKKEKIVMYAIGAGAIVNIILNFILIPKYGAVGAAWSTVVSEFMVFLGLVRIIKNEINITFLLTLLKGIAISAISCLGGYGLNHYFKIHEIISSIASFILFGGFIFLFKITSVEEIKGYIRK